MIYVFFLWSGCIDLDRIEEEKQREKNLRPDDLGVLLVCLFSITDVWTFYASGFFHIHTYSNKMANEFTNFTGVTYEKFKCSARGLILPFGKDFLYFI